jgi:hypothetical protein
MQPIKISSSTVPSTGWYHIILTYNTGTNIHVPNITILTHARCYTRTVPKCILKANYITTAVLITFLYILPVIKQTGFVLHVFMCDHNGLGPWSLVVVVVLVLFLVLVCENLTLL